MRKILAFVCALMCFSASLFSETTDGIIFAEKLQKILSEGTLEQAINLFSEIPDSLKDDKDLTILKASLIFSAKRYDEAQEIADNLLLHYPDDIGVLELKAEIAFAKKDSKMLKTVSEKILSINPYNAIANIIKANQFALKKNYKQADVYYKKALVSEPENLEAM